MVGPICFPETFVMMDDLNNYFMNYFRRYYLYTRLHNLFHIIGKSISLTLPLEFVQVLDTKKAN